MVIPSNAAPLRPLRRAFADRVVPFSEVIVWDALIDADLADGWLGHLIIDPVPGGRFALVWPTGEPHPADWYGTIDEMITCQRIAVRFAPHTTISFELRAQPVREGGGSSVSVLHESFLTAVEADRVTLFWEHRLDLLGSLLRGRPVDWRHGERLD